SDVLAAPTFRVSSLKFDATLDVVEASFGRRTPTAALEALGLTPRDVQRLAKAVAPIRRLAAFRAQDRILLATTRDTHALRAVELEIAPGDVLLVRDAASIAPPSSPSPSPSPSSSASSSASPARSAPIEGLIVERLTLPVTHKRLALALVVETDLLAAVAAAGLDASIVEPLDDALGSRQDIPAVQRGSTLKIVADASLVDGAFDRYDDVVALEYRSRADAAASRLYHLREQRGAGWYDGKGQQPVRGKWRAPVPFPRVTSRFNPKRMHPLLHTVMPHNGCDFGAPTGTPVYSIGAGTIVFRAEAGPSGNLVSIAHDGGLESGYAHLSRFVPGITVGTHVEPHTLVGYVGTTGRSTGPHLHLSLKRNGVFIDPQSLKLDGVRVVPHGLHDDFVQRKSDADVALDGIVVPKAIVPTTPSPAPSPSIAPSNALDDEAAMDDLDKP
ncbi:MAG: M23 family metallopeptidase, partial [Polyangiales bacterium]